MGKEWHDEGTLRELYIEEGLSLRDIGDELGCSDETVRRWLDNHGIDRRKSQETPADELKNETWLREKYWGEFLSMSEIADELGVDITTVSRWIDNHGIDKRDQSTATSLSSLSSSAFEKLSDCEWLEEQYHGKEKSLSEIADELGCSKDAVQGWMVENGIQRRGEGARSKENHHSWRDDFDTECEICGNEFRRTQEKHKGRFCSPSCYGKAKSVESKGEDNPNWNGGYNGYYGPNWPEQQTKARKRDNYTCQRCGMVSEEHHEEYGCELHVHHISNKNNFEDYEKMNRLSNLVTLCCSCHKQLEGIPIDHRHE